MEKSKDLSIILDEALLKIFDTKVDKVSEMNSKIAESLTCIVGFEEKIHLFLTCNLDKRYEVDRMDCEAYLKTFMTKQEKNNELKKMIEDAAENGKFCYEDEVYNMMDSIKCGDYFLNNFISDKELNNKKNIKILLKNVDGYLSDLLARTSYTDKVIESVYELYSDGEYPMDDIEYSLEYFMDYYGEFAELENPSIEEKRKLKKLKVICDGLKNIVDSSYQKNLKITCAQS